MFYGLYLDATGDAGWPAPFGKSICNWYVVAGLALTPKMDRQAYQETDNILKKYIPQSEWNSPKFELCYHDLIYGKKGSIYENIDDSIRLSIANEVFDFYYNFQKN